VSSEVQLSGNEMLNKKVLSSRRKVRNDVAVRRETDRVFHARAAATGNARSPRLDRLAAGTNKGDDMLRTSSVVSRRGRMGHYHADSGRPGHTNGTDPDGATIFLSEGIKSMSWDVTAPDTQRLSMKRQSSRRYTTKPWIQ